MKSLKIVTLISVLGSCLVAGIVALVGTSIVTIDTLKVGGPIYQRIADDKDLVADILPPPEYIIEAYLEATLALNDPASLAVHRQRLEQLRKDYEDRRAYWANKDIDAAVRAKLTRDSDAEVRQFWSELDRTFLPALARNDHAAAAGSYAALTRAYTAHRAIIDAIVKDTDRLSAQTEADAAHQEQRLTLVEYATAAIALLMAIGAVLALLRLVVRPLVGMTAAMGRLAGGELATMVPALDRRDEIGAMAKAVEVFKHNAVERQRQEAAEIEQAARRDERQRRMERLTRDFDGAALAVMQTVTEAAAKMMDMSKGMTSIAEETQRQGTVVSAATEQASANVSVIASASHELSASIQEIASQVTRSATTSADAVEEVAAANTKMKCLAAAASRIGEVVDLINDIASRTNLLALNATIEAARAGEAGKGFAVVAGEVKALANQTAKATGDIVAQIQAIQEETRGVVEAIQRVSTVINQISEMSSAIAGAIEEQGAAMAEVVRNVEEAATGTREVAANIAGVVEAAGRTGAMANQVLGAAGQLTDENGKLRGSVETFLDGVKAA